MTKFVFNSIKAFSMCSITAFMFACSQEDNFESETNGHNREQESFFNGEIEVNQDGYLSFKSDEVFKDYINLINEKTKWGVDESFSINNPWIYFYSLS